VETFTAQGANGKKSSIRKVVIILFGLIRVVEFTYSLFSLFPTGFIDVAKFVADVIYTSGKFCVADTRSNFASSVVDTGGAP
jgi:hypothetical protein